MFVHNNHRRHRPGNPLLQHLTNRSAGEPPEHQLPTCVLARCTLLITALPPIPAPNASAMQLPIINTGALWQAVLPSRSLPCHPDPYPACPAMQQRHWHTLSTHTEVAQACRCCVNISSAPPDRFIPITHSNPAHTTTPAAKHGAVSCSGTLGSYNRQLRVSCWEERLHSCCHEGATTPPLLQVALVLSAGRAPAPLAAAGGLQRRLHTQHGWCRLHGAVGSCHRHLQVQVLLLLGLVC